MSKLSILIADKSYLIRKGLVSILLEFPSVGQINECDEQDSLMDYLEYNSYQICFINPSIANSEVFRIINKKLKKDILLVAILTSKTTKQIQLDQFNEYIFLDDKKSQLAKKMDELFNRFKKELPESEDASVLSDREKSILRHIALGFTNKEIGEKLFISIHTVVTHRKNITRKIGIKTVSGLTVYSIFNKIVGIDEIRISK